MGPSNPFPENRYIFYIKGAYITFPDRDGGLLRNTRVLCCNASRFLGPSKDKSNSGGFRSFLDGM